MLKAADSSTSLADRIIGFLSREPRLRQRIDRWQARVDREAMEQHVRIKANETTGRGGG